MVGCCWPGAGDCVRGLGERPPKPATRTVRRRRPRAVRLPTDPSVVTLARRAHAGTAVPQAPEALTGSPELPSLGDRGTLGREGWGGLGLAGSQRPRLAALRYSINRSRSVLIMIIETDGLPMRMQCERSVGRESRTPSTTRLAKSAACLKCGCMAVAWPPVAWRWAARRLCPVACPWE